MSRSVNWIVALCLIASAIVVGKSQPAFEDATLVKAKDAVAVSPQAINYLSAHEKSGKVKVWVFFTDKGIYTKQQFNSAALAAKEGFSERTLARRLRNGVSEARFTDLAVNQKYVDALATTGAKIRRVSRWLNAASCEVEISKLGLIGGFGFVQRVEPVALYKKTYDEVSPVKMGIDVEEMLDAHSLSYGSSATQLNQISVPQCHDSGFAGAGVIISMFDSGFRTTHNSFTAIRLEHRLLKQHDFIFDDSVVDNQPIDDPSAWSHGTSTWSTCGGENPGIHYGPAYKASFILCKTEDIRSETQVEEDNWVAAMEWVDGLGTDIISSSLGYTDWYVQSQYDGNTCVTTVAADIAAQNGIIVCNSAGNSGPGASTLGAPADADSIITVGAVTSTGTIASFSSRGPTADGRMKPEVCAMGSSDYVASSSADNSYGFSSGTSFSCPLTAGVAGVILSAHPQWTNMQVREAMMMTGSRSATPDNTFGWGIGNAWGAVHYPIDPPPVYVHGDANSDGFIDISDPVFIINYVFGGGPEPAPKAAGDADCSGLNPDVGDAVYLIDFIFGGGPGPC